MKRTHFNLKYGGDSLKIDDKNQLFDMLNEDQSTGRINYLNEIVTQNTRFSIDFDGGDVDMLAPLAGIDKTPLQLIKLALDQDKRLQSFCKRGLIGSACASPPMIKFSYHLWWPDLFMTRPNCTRLRNFIVSELKKACASNIVPWEKIIDSNNATLRILGACKFEKGEFDRAPHPKRPIRLLGWIDENGNLDRTSLPPFREALELTTLRDWDGTWKSKCISLSGKVVNCSSSSSIQKSRPFSGAANENEKRVSKHRALNFIAGIGVIPEGTEITNEKERDLFRIPCAGLGYIEWFSVACAAKHGQISFNLFDTWSKQDSRYNDKQTYNLWNSIKERQNHFSESSLRLWANEANN